MDFSFLKRWEALLTIAAAGALGSTATVVVVSPPAAEQAERCLVCEAELASVRGRLEQMAKDREEAERYRRFTPSTEEPRRVGVEELRRR